ncbi:MAG: SPOR domain-containing protein [Balneolales bacterium]
MIKSTKYFTLLLSLAFIIQACGPSQEEIEQQERAMLDSLAQVQASQQAAAERAAQAEEEARLAELQKEEEEEEVETEEKEEFIPILFDENGKFTLQVEAWRSESFAEHGAKKWQDRGFDRAFVVQYGDEGTGDLWYRIRLGRFGSYKMAKRQQENILSDFNISSWIDVEK